MKTAPRPVNGNWIVESASSITVVNSRLGPAVEPSGTVVMLGYRSSPEHWPKGVGPIPPGKIPGRDPKPFGAAPGAYDSLIVLARPATPAQKSRGHLRPMGYNAVFIGTASANLYARLVQREGGAQ